jgi:hypothetical protein
MDAFVSLITNLAINACTMCDCVAASKDTSQVINVIETSDDKLGIFGTRASCDSNHFMSFASQSRSQMAADETSGACNCDSHWITPNRSGNSAILL